MVALSGSRVVGVALVLCGSIAIATGCGSWLLSARSGDAFLVAVVAVVGSGVFALACGLAVAIASPRTVQSTMAQDDRILWMAAALIGAPCVTALLAGAVLLASLRGGAPAPPSANPPVVRNPNCRWWTNTVGDKVFAEYVGMDGDDVLVRDPNGGVAVPVDVDGLCSDDVRWLVERGAIPDPDPQPDRDSDRRARD